MKPIAVVAFLMSEKPRGRARGFVGKIASSGMDFKTGAGL